MNTSIVESTETTPEQVNKPNLIRILFSTEIVYAQPKFGKSGKKICCSCPETKKPRDECVVSKGEEHCKDYIDAHKACLRQEGFFVR